MEGTGMSERAITSPQRLRDSCRDLRQTMTCRDYLTVVATDDGRFRATCRACTGKACLSPLCGSASLAMQHLPCRQSSVRDAVARDGSVHHVATRPEIIDDVLGDAGKLDCDYFGHLGTSCVGCPALDGGKCNGSLARFDLVRRAYECGKRDGR